MGQKIFWVKNIYWAKKSLGKKMFWLKKIWGTKFLGQKDLDPKFFCLKKQVGLTQGGVYMTPPPQKIVGLKFCWVVHSCPKRFFAKKKKYW